MKNLLIAVLLLPSHTMAANEGSVLKDLISKIEDLATEFAQRVEELYLDRRCNATDLKACSEANYNGCTSTLPGAACNVTTELIITNCKSCSSVLDFTVSSVLVPTKMSEEASTSNTEHSPPSDISAFLTAHTFFFSSSLKAYASQEVLTATFKKRGWIG